MATANSEYLYSAKIIEFFWLLGILILTLQAFLMKFFWHKEIHPAQYEGPQTQSKKYLEADKKNKPADIINKQNDQENQVIKDDASQQNSQIPQDQQKVSIGAQIQNAVYGKADPTTEESKTFKFIKSFERIIDNYLPLLAVALLCVGQFASYIFAAFCVFAFFFCVILFNELDIQQNCDQACPKGLFKYLYHIWLVALFLNYFVYKEE